MRSQNLQLWRNPQISENVVKWGKKQVENWGDWLMKGVKWGKKQVDNLGENLGEWFMNLEAPEADETEAYETAAEEADEKLMRS